MCFEMGKGIHSLICSCARQLSLYMFEGWGEAERVESDRLIARARYRQSPGPQANKFSSCL